MIDREPGFYWVKMEAGYPANVGYWCGLHWWLARSEWPCSDTYFYEIGPKIEPPKPNYVQVWLPTAIEAFKAGLLEDGMTDCAPIISAIRINLQQECVTENN